MLEPCQTCIRTYQMKPDQVPLVPEGTMCGQCCKESREQQEAMEADLLPYCLPLPVPVQIPNLIKPTICGGAADQTGFWIQGEDLWDFWQHPITGEVKIQIPPIGRPYRTNSMVAERRQMGLTGRQPKVKLFRV